MVLSEIEELYAEELARRTGPSNDRGSSLSRPDPDDRRLVPRPRAGRARPRRRDPGGRPRDPGLGRRRDRARRPPAALRARPGPGARRDRAGEDPLRDPARRRRPRPYGRAGRRARRPLHRRGVRRASRSRTPGSPAPPTGSASPWWARADPGSRPRRAGCATSRRSRSRWPTAASRRPSPPSCPPRTRRSGRPGRWRRSRCTPRSASCWPTASSTLRPSAARS